MEKRSTATAGHEASTMAADPQEERLPTQFKKKEKGPKFKQDIIGEVSFRNDNKNNT